MDDSPVKVMQQVSIESSDAAVPADPLIGVVAGEKYRIEALLARGGWGRVYSARQEPLGRAVAIKVLNDHFAGDFEKIKRFQSEAEAAGALAHENIARVYDYGLLEHDGSPYIVMELLAGESLAQLLARQKRLDWRSAMPIFAGCAKALSGAHAAGVIHRDVKPSNIMVTKENDLHSAKLLDFGIARIVSDEGRGHTATGDIVGTAAYMSPEQCQGQPVGASSDIYSFGCVMYEVLTGARANPGKNTFECLHNHLYAEPTRFAAFAKETGEIPSSLEAVIWRCLAKDSQDRYQSFEELLVDLDVVLAGGKIQFSRKRPAKKGKPSRTSWPVVAATVVSLLAIIGALLFAPSQEQTYFNVPDPSKLPEENREHDIWQPSELLPFEAGEIRKASQFLANTNPQAAATMVEQLKQVESAGPVTSTAKAPLVSLVHLFQGQGRTQTSDRGTGSVHVSYTGGPMKLVLSSYYPVSWHVTASPGVQLERITVNNGSLSDIVEAPSGVKLTAITAPDALALKEDFSNTEMSRVYKVLESVRLTPDTMQALYCYAGTPLEVGPADGNWSASHKLFQLQDLYRQSVPIRRKELEPLLKDLRFQIAISRKSQAGQHLQPAQCQGLSLTSVGDVIAETPTTGPWTFAYDKKRQIFYTWNGDRQLRALDNQGKVTHSWVVPEGYSGLITEGYLTFDSRRNLVVLQGWPEDSCAQGLCSLDPQTGAWRVFNAGDKGEYFSRAAITYSPEDDSFYRMIENSDKPIRQFQVLNAADGRVLRTIKLSHPIESDWHTSTQLSRSGKYLVAARNPVESEKEMQLIFIDIATGEIVWADRLELPPVREETSH